MLLIWSGLQAQPEHQVWAEVATARPVYQLGYALSWPLTDRSSLAIQAGFSLAPGATALPAGMYYSWGGHTHRAVLSAGATVLVEDFFSFDQQISDTYLYLHPGVGYQWAPPDRHWSFRLVAMPSLRMDPTATRLWDPEGFWVGVLQAGVGFRIGKRKP
ncbi:MAG: hypothetical protein D6722_28330 [Bacteroidetes bacterium]|nr:MAG: hypothetical protein D6722_28330 [Bacteroidota bacterium]